MKGYTSFLLSVAAVAGTILVLANISIKFISDNTVRDVISIDADKDTMLYSLDVAKLYLETSLRYSLYQSCYDLLKSGKNTVDNSNFEIELKNSVLKNLNTYAEAGYNFLGTYAVSLPNYETIEIKFDNSKPEILVTANSKSNLIISKSKIVRGLWEDSTTFEKTPKLETAVKTPCKRIYDKGVAKKTEIENMLPNHIKSAKTAIGLQDSYTVSGDLATQPDKVLKQGFGAEKTEIENKWKEELKKMVEKTDSNENGFIINVKLGDFSFTILPTCEADTSASPVTTTCNFVYSTKAKVSISVKSADKEKFPVWNGRELKMEEMEGMFAAEK